LVQTLSSPAELLSGSLETAASAPETRTPELSLDTETVNEQKLNQTALRDCKPPPRPKSQPKFIRDLHPNIRINPDFNLDVCQITAKML